MAFNLFNKLYVSPDYLYDNSQTRILFSKMRNQAGYLTYDSLNHSGYAGRVLESKESIYLLVGDGEGQYQSIAHYIVDLYNQGVEGRIYADEESWNAIFFTWIRMALPDCTPAIAFRIYNFIKQREQLVYPDNMAYKSFMDSRLKDRATNKILTQTEFLSAFATFIDADPVDPAYYEQARLTIKDDLCIEVKLASYLAGDTTVDNLAVKIQNITSKLIFKVILDTKDYIRENIMTEHVKAITGINLSWDNQDWEQTLINKSPEMAFMFNTSEDAMVQSVNYRKQNIDKALDWCRWVVDNTDSSGGDLEWWNISAAAKLFVEHANIFSVDVDSRNVECAAVIDKDIDFVGTTFVFQVEDLREKINTFWIEYVYQLAKANNIEGLKQISHR